MQGIHFGLLMTMFYTVIHNCNENEEEHILTVFKRLNIIQNILGRRI